MEGEQLKNFIANQYQNLFTSCIGQIDEVLNCVGSRVTQDMNEALMEPFTGKEIWRALENIGNLKAPGADSMPSIFYKKFWSLIGNQAK